MISATIMICSYNGALSLETSLNSAIEQTLSQEHYEILFLDDGSTDNTTDIIKPYLAEHPNIRYLFSAQNMGLQESCNWGVEQANGECIIRLDVDDKFSHEILERMLSPILEGSTDLVYSDRYEVSQDGTIVFVPIQRFSPFQLIAAGTMFRLSSMRNLGGYRKVFWEEYDLYLRYLQSGYPDPIHIPHPLYYYFRHNTSMTANSNNVSNGWQELLNIWGESTLINHGWTGSFQEGTYL